MLQPKARFFPLVFLANAIATSGSTTFEQHTQGDGFHTNSCSSIGTHQVDLQYVYSLEPKWKTDSWPSQTTDDVLLHIYIYITYIYINYIKCLWKSGTPEIHRNPTVYLGGTANNQQGRPQSKGTSRKAPCKFSELTAWPHKQGGYFWDDRGRGSEDTLW